MTIEPLPYFRATVRVEHVFPRVDDQGYVRTNDSTLADVVVTGGDLNALIDHLADHVGCLSNAYAPTTDELHTLEKP